MSYDVKVCFVVSRIHNIIAAQARALPHELHAELLTALTQAVRTAIESARPKRPEPPTKG